MTLPISWMPKLFNDERDGDYCDGNDDDDDYDHDNLYADIKPISWMPTMIKF